MPREEMHVCKPRCVNSRSEAASHVLRLISVERWVHPPDPRSWGVGGGGISFSTTVQGGLEVLEYFVHQALCCEDITV